MGVQPGAMGTLHVLDAVVQKQRSRRVQTMAFAHVKEGLRMRLLHAQIVAVMRRLERPPKRRSVRKRGAQVMFS